MAEQESIMTVATQAAKVAAGMLVARFVIEPLVPDALPFDGADVIADVGVGALATKADKYFGIGIAASGVVGLADTLIGKR